MAIARGSQGLACSGDLNSVRAEPTAPSAPTRVAAHRQAAAIAAAAPSASTPLARASSMQAKGTAGARSPCLTLHRGLAGSRGDEATVMECQQPAQPPMLQHECCSGGRRHGLAADVPPSAGVSPPPLQALRALAPTPPPRARSVDRAPRAGARNFRTRGTQPSELPGILVHRSLRLTGGSSPTYSTTHSKPTWQQHVGTHARQAGTPAVQSSDRTGTLTCNYILWSM